MPPLFYFYIMQRIVQRIMQRIMQLMVAKSKNPYKKLASSGSAPYNTELLRAEGSDANEDR